MRVGGVCAILYVIAVVAAIALLSSVDLLDVENADEVLPALDDDQAIAAGGGWLFALAPILLTFAGLGLFQLLRPAGSVLWVALVAFSGGAFLILVRAFIWLARPTSWRRPTSIPQPTSSARSQPSAIRSSASGLWPSSS